MNRHDAYDSLHAVLEWLDAHGLDAIAIDVNQALEKLLEIHSIEGHLPDRQPSVHLR